jgi:L-asparaginase II
MAAELGVTAKNVKATDTIAPEAFVFLGTGCYGATLPKAISQFMERNKFQGRKVALFTTSAFGSVAERNLVQKQISGKGAEVTDNFKCIGHWMTMKKQHPTPQELVEAKAFARGVAAKQNGSGKKAKTGKPA